MTAALVGLLVATALAVLAAPLLTRLYLADDSLVDVGLANALAYLLLPQIFFYGIAALFGAILNTKEKFGVPAWAPVANNLVVIGVGIALLLHVRRRERHRRRAQPADPRRVAVPRASAPPRASCCRRW